MGTVLGLVAYHGYAGVTEFETIASTPRDRRFPRARSRWSSTTKSTALIPARWIGKVTVRTRDGRELTGPCR